MKRAIFSGTKWILCNILLCLVTFLLTACSADTTNAVNEASTAESAAMAEKASESTAAESTTAVEAITAAESVPADETAGTTEAEIPKAAETYSGIEICFTYQRATTMASNQIAVWAEDADGAVVKTLLVTDFTAGRRGYRNRDTSLPVWVKAAAPESMTDEEIDALSSATPQQGHLTYVWDFTDDTGERIPEGIYTIRVEGTLFWESSVLYTAVIDFDHLEDEIRIEMDRTAPDMHENEDMISNVIIRAIKQEVEK